MPQGFDSGSRGEYEDRRQGKKPPKPVDNNTPSETAPITFPEPKPAKVMRPSAVQEQMADKAMFSAARTRDIFDQTPVSELAVYQTPDSMFQASTVQIDPVVSSVLNDYTLFLATLHGNEAMGAMMGTEFITDPNAREATQRLISELMKLPYPSYQPGTSPLGQTRSDEELVGLLTAGDIDAFRDVTPGDRNRLKTLAEELLGTLEELPDTGQQGDFKRAIAVGVSGDLTLALSEQEIQAVLDGIPALEKNAGFGGTTQEVTEEGSTTPNVRGAEFFGDITQNEPVAPGLAALGVEQYRNQGEGVIVINPDDAARNPAKAYALQLLIKQEFPDKQIQYGREGAWSSLLDHLGQPVDYVTAPLGAAMQQVSELGERVGRSDDDKKAAKVSADAIADAVATGDMKKYLEIRKELRPLYDLPGGVDPSDDVTWVGEAHRTISMLNEFATDDVGFEKFYDQMGENTRPQVAGFGFADSFTRSADLMPGDSGFNAMYAVSGLVGALMFDPLNWGPAIIGGIRQASLVPKFKTVMKSPDVVAALLQIERPALTDAAALKAAQRAIETGATLTEVGGRVVKPMTYRLLAQTPEVFATTAPVRATWKALWKVKQALGTEDATAVFASFFAGSKRLGGEPKVARYLAQAESLEEMEMFGMGAMTGLHVEMPNLAGIQNRINELTARLAPKAAPAAEEGVSPLIDQIGRGTLPMSNGLSEADELDNIAELARLQDMLDGRDFIQPLKLGFSTKDYRRLAQMTHERVDRLRPLQEAGQELEEAISADRLAKGGQELTAALAVDPTIQPKALKFWQRFRNSFKDTGAGHQMTFPGVSARAHTLANETLGTVDEVATRLRTANPELSWARARMAARSEIAAAGPMADDVNRSFEAIGNMMRRFGLNDDRITELMKPWALGQLDEDPIASFNWFTAAWQNMVDESPRLNSLGKEHFSKMFDSFAQERGGGKIRVVGADGRVTYEHTLQEMIENPLGDLEPHPFPAISARMLKSYKLPSEKELVEWFSVMQRTMREWKKAGGARKAVSLLHGGMSSLWAGWNQLWKTWVLVPRLGGAIPLRIGIEQQLRMPAAAEAASMVWSPMEWFKSTTKGTKLFPDTDLALMGASPAHALGTTIDAYDVNVNRRLLHMGRNYVTIGDEKNLPAFFRGYADQLREMAASPEVREWHLPHLGSPETALSTMEQSPMGKHFLGLYRDRNVDEIEAITRTQTELAQLIGTGTDAPLVRAAVRTGKAKIDGEIVTVGTEQFADALHRMYQRGTWVPGTGEIPVSAGVYLPAEKLDTLREIRDTLFHYGYAAPDVALARSPLWRQLAAREYRNNIRLGYSPEKALNMAYASAARRTADVMFHIGASSPGDYFLRNISPFFPAWRELGETWLLRIPQRIGEGSRVLGGAAMLRRADIWIDFFKQVGWLQTDAEGRNIIPVGFLRPLIKLFGGGDGSNFSFTSFAESTAGLLPAPTTFFTRDAEGNLLPLRDRVGSVTPTVGQPAGYGLGLLDKLTDGAITPLTDWLTLTGPDTSLGPRQIDQAFEALVHQPPPWVIGQSRNAHQAMINSSIIDGMRIAMQDNHHGNGPNPADFDENNDGDLTAEEQRKFRAASKEWVEAIIHDGNAYSTAAYMTKAVTGMFLPFSVQFEDADKDKFNKLWSFIDTLPEEIQDVYIGPLLDSNPGLADYMAGKTIDTRRVDDPNETMDEFFDAVAAGDITFRSPEEYAIFSWGMQSYSNYLSRVDAIYANAGDTPAEQIMNFDSKKAIEREREAWDDFLAVTSIVDNFMPGQTQSFEDMLNAKQGYDRIRDEGAGRMRPSLEMEQVIEFDRVMKHYAQYFTINYDKADKFFDLKDAAYAATGGGPQSALAQANEWFFGSVVDVYHDKLEPLYDSLDFLDDDKKAPIYQKIRDLSNKYNKVYVNPEHPEWGEFSSPEAYSFAQLPTEDQDMQVTHWADLPAYYLTEFQREQVGYEIEDQEKANKLADYVTRNEIKFDKQIDHYNLEGTAAEDANRVIFDKAYAKKAEELGLADYWKEANAPAYKRIGKALNLGERTGTWNLAVKAVERGIQTITHTRSPSTGEFYTARSTSEAAERVHHDVATLIERWKENDPAFRKVMDDLAVALGDDGSPLGPQDLVDTLFFDVFQF